MQIDNLDSFLEDKKKAEADINAALDALETRQAQAQADRMVGTAVSAVILIIEEIHLLIPIIKKIVSVLFFVPKRWRKTILKFLTAVEAVLPSEGESDEDANSAPLKRVI